MSRLPGALSRLHTSEQRRAPNKASEVNKVLRRAIKNLYQHQLQSTTVYNLTGTDFDIQIPVNDTQN